MEFYVECHAYLLTLLTHIATSYLGLHLSIALMAKRTILIAYEATVSQLFGAQLTAKALRMPAGGHGLDNTSDNELSALVAAGGKQYMEVPFAVFAPLELVENAILERTEALSATGKQRLPVSCTLSRLYCANTYTKHCVCQSSPLELTIFSVGSKPSAHLVQCIASSDMLMA